MKIGFVGLGLMGLPMAHRLLAAGHELLVMTGNAAARASLEAAGANAAQSIADIAAQVEVFCSCRVTPAQSREVFLGDSGVAAARPHNLLCIDFATIDPTSAKQIGGELAALGIDYLDAPISGGPDGAEAGTLSIIVGGEAAAVARAKPLFEAIGKRTLHMGGLGTGVTAKLCNNMITITTHALLAEAMVLGVKAGIDARELYNVLSSSSAGSRTLERVVPGHFLPRDFRPAATVATIMKDLQCALELGRESGVRLLLPAVALQCYVEAAGRGHAEDDIASVILAMEEIAGIEVGPA